MKTHIIVTAALVIATAAIGPDAHAQQKSGGVQKIDGGGTPMAGGGSARGGFRGTPQTGGRPTNANGVPLGPSGKPMRYGTTYSTRSGAAEAARRAGTGAPIQHNGHFHSSNGGEKTPGTHYYYGGGRRVNIE